MSDEFLIELCYNDDVVGQYYGVAVPRVGDAIVDKKTWIVTDVCWVAMQCRRDTKRLQPIVNVKPI